MKLAFASSDGVVVNQHFGHTPCFWIIELNEENGEWDLLEKRVNDPPCKFGEHDEGALNGSVDLIRDCRAVFAVKVGNYAQTLLQRSGLQVLEIKGYIREITEGYIIYLKKIRYFEKINKGMER